MKSPFWLSGLHAAAATVLTALAYLSSSLLLLLIGYLLLFLMVAAHESYRFTVEILRKAQGYAQPSGYDARAIRQLKRIIYQIQNVAQTLALDSKPKTIKKFQDLRLELIEEVTRLGGRHPIIEYEAEQFTRRCTPWHGPNENLTDEEFREFFMIPMERSLEALLVACADAFAGRQISSSTSAQSADNRD
ncbi:MAG TPA: hypothetical protein VHQ65_07745 [Thermoanaerobaculia bacterium]|nr:hypothetical protein [Thermoanaerobaculia bacterium]